MPNTNAMRWPPRQIDRARNRLPAVERRHGDLSGSRRTRDRERDLRKRFVKRGVRPARCRARRQRARARATASGSGKRCGRTRCKYLEAHRLHRPCGCADVARMTRIAEDHANVGQGIDARHGLQYAPLENHKARPSCQPVCPIMHPMLNTAVKAARRAGNIINRAPATSTCSRSAKRPRTISCPKSIARRSRRSSPHCTKPIPEHAILAEESGARGTSEYQWIIDPLDGTTNYLHGFPQYCVSIALEHRRVITQAVIYDPVAQRSVHREPRTRRVPERDAHPREQARAAEARSHRHRIPVHASSRTWMRTWRCCAT